jgi:hypothetical protein
MNKTVVLLTSCIAPGDMTGLARSDIFQRLEDYKNVIQNLSSSGFIGPVVYCDNSGYNLEQLARIPVDTGSTGKWEFLSINGNRKKNLGKGYGEMEIIRYAIESSRLITPDSKILKVTGRLTLRNICSICSQFEESPISTEIFCDLRGNLQWADSRVFASSVRFLQEYLLPLESILNDSRGVSFEHVLARATHSAMSDGLNWKMLPETPDIVGLSGTSGIRYPDRRLDFWRREFFRRLKTWCISRAF